VAYVGPAGLVTGTGSVTLKGANVVFNGPATAPGAISLGGTIIEADPPSVSTMLTAPVFTSTAMAPLNNVVISDRATPAQAHNVLIPPTASATTFDLAALTSLSSLAGLDNTLSLTVGAGNGFARSIYGGISDTRRWISATEIAGGEIPITLRSDKDVTVRRGSVLVMPTSDSTVRTPAGDVFVGKGSMALIMVLDGGMAVYNLHDTHKDAVVITGGGRKISLQPGTSATIVPSHVKRFEHVNPAQLVFYRRVAEQELDGGLKAFRSEFAIHSMVSAVPHLRSLILSSDGDSARVGKQFLKTLSILMQLQTGGGEKFSQFMRPQMTAWQ